MVELVQATPEELDAFSDRCARSGEESTKLVRKAESEVERVRARWGGEFAKAFGARWATWQKDMSEFPLALLLTMTEMKKLAAIYRQADEQAAAATKGVPGVGG